MSQSPTTPCAERAHPSPEGGSFGRVARWLWEQSGFGQPTQTACRACGACCELFGGHLRAAKSDLARWQAEGRQDLLSRVNRLGWLWVDPHTSEALVRCPFLVRTSPEAAHCAIHETKPEMCRAYPTLAHGRRCVRGGLVH